MWWSFIHDAPTPHHCTHTYTTHTLIPGRPPASAWPGRTAAAAAAAPPRLGRRPSGARRRLRGSAAWTGPVFREGCVCVVCIIVVCCWGSAVCVGVVGNWSVARARRNTNPPPLRLPPSKNIKNTNPHLLLVRQDRVQILLQGPKPAAAPRLRRGPHGGVVGLGGQFCLQREFGGDGEDFDVHAPAQHGAVCCV